MKPFWKCFCALMLCLLLPLGSAWSEECFTIDVDALDMNRLNSDDYIAQMLSSAAQGIRIRKHIAESSELASSVRVTLTQMDTRALLFDKNYSYQTGVFDSGVLYLPYVKDSTVPYLITLYVGDYVYALPFMHQQRRMVSNSACTAGVRLGELDPAQGNDWMMGTVIDLNALSQQGCMPVEICASNSYVIGTALLRMNGGKLSVELNFTPSADVTLESGAFYVAADQQQLSEVSMHRLDETVSVQNASSALIYLDLQVSYNPAGLPVFCYDPAQLVSQQRLWTEAHQYTNRSKTDSSYQFSTPDSWSSGWSSGWDDGWDDGWSSGW